MKFPNPFAPPKLNSTENPSPSVKADRELHTKLTELFSKVDSEPLVYYSKYLCVYTSVQYYLYVHSLNSAGNTNFYKNVEQTVDNAVRTFDRALPPQVGGVAPLYVKGTHLYYLNVMKSNPTNPLGSLFYEVKLKDSSYVQDTADVSNNVRYKLYENLRSSLSSTLNQYSFQDSNHGAKLTRDSLELLFFELLSVLQPYRRYFVTNVAQLYTFAELNASVSKLQYEGSAQQSNVVLSNFLRARGLQEVPYGSSTNWRSEFEDLEKLVRSVLSKYSPFSQSNVLYSNVLQKTEVASSVHLSNKSTVTTLNFEVTKSGDKELKVVNSSELNYTNELNDRGVWYYDSRNVKTYNSTVSYSGSVLTLKNPVGELSSSNKYLTFSLTPVGCNLSSNVNFGQSPVTYSTLDKNVFSLKLEDTQTSTVLHESNVQFNDQLFNSNVLSASNKFDVRKFGVYYSKEGEVGSNFVVSGSFTQRVVLFSADTGDDWVKVSKVPRSTTTGESVPQSVRGSGGFTTFNLITAGTKYFSVDVPNDGGNFASELQLYVLRRPSNPSDNLRYVTSLTLGNPTQISENVKRYSVTFNVPQSALRSGTPNSFYLLLHYKLDEANSNVVRFNNLYLSESSGLGTYTFNSGSDFINKLYSYSGSSVWGRYVTASYSGSTLKLSSEPRYLGSRYKLTLTPVVNKNLGFGNVALQTVGKNSYVLSPNGYEKKFYDNFISYLKSVFIALNSYALARLIVPEALEDESYFNNDVKVNVRAEELKGLISDLLEDSGLTNQEYADKLYADPRSKFVQETSPQQDFPKELQWKSSSLGSLLPQSQLNSIKSSLETVKSAITRLRSLLEAVRSFIEILSALFELAEDLVEAALDTVIEQLQKVLNNISSTGVYFLPLWNHYRTNDILWGAPFEQWLASNPDKTIKDFMKESLQGYYVTSKDAYTKQYYTDLYETNRMIYGNDSFRSADVSGANYGNEKFSFYDELLPFRATNHQEFIELIEECFLDKSDNYQAQAATRIDDFGGQILARGQSVLQPGRPLFGTGSRVEVFVGAVTLPDPELSRSAAVAFATSVLRIVQLINFIREKASSNYKTKAQEFEGIKKQISEAGNDVKLMKQAIDSANNFFAKNSDSFIETEYQLRLYLYGVGLETSNEEPDEHVESLLTSPRWSQERSERSSNGWINTAADYLFGGNDWELINYAKRQNEVLPEPPNFVGVSLASLLPGIFTTLNWLVDRLRYFNSKKEEPTLAETLETWVSYFEEVISEIDDVLYLIEKVVALIDALLGISVTYLRVSTTRGVEGFLEELRNASNFPNEDSSQVILGFVGLVGFPTPGDPALNLSEYFSSVSKEFNEEASDLISDLKLDNEGEGLSFLNKILPKS